jgi:hypothetical protein
LEWLDSPVLAKTASDAFNTILNDNSKEHPVMIHKSSSNLKLFYKQRFFNLVIEPLKTRFDSRETIHKGTLFFFKLRFLIQSLANQLYFEEQKLFYTMAVLNMVGLLPREVIQKQLKSVNIVKHQVFKSNFDVDKFLILF